MEPRQGQRPHKCKSQRKNNALTSRHQLVEILTPDNEELGHLRGHRGAVSAIPENPLDQYMIWFFLKQENYMFLAHEFKFLSDVVEYDEMFEIVE
jgi:hypothetical protein